MYYTNTEMFSLSVYSFMPKHSMLLMIIDVIIKRFQAFFMHSLSTCTHSSYNNKAMLSPSMHQKESIHFYEITLNLAHF